MVGFVPWEDLCLWFLDKLAAAEDDQGWQYTFSWLMVGLVVLEEAVEAVEAVVSGGGGVES